jgi:A/G-specific adenine glycosylase
VKDKYQKFEKKVWDLYKNNKRDFPWRRTKDPYKILVSEMMLQQTQTSRVIEKYEAFLKSFPTISELSKAPQSEVLKLWQGLGYNRRALYLKRTATIIYERHDGIVPYTKEKLVTLPGIGPNTAGAIIAFSYNKPVVFIETNIRRVFIYEFFEGAEKVGDESLFPLIEETLDRENPRSWYYALMDYGAYLGKRETNPNRQSKHYKLQTKFEGSKRQTRGKIIKLLSEMPYQQNALKQLFENAAQYDEAVGQLLQEGFIEEKGDKFILKS